MIRQSRPTLQLDITLPVVLDGSGNGQVQLSPDGSHEHWYPTVVSVKVAPPITNEAACKIYAGPTPTDAYFVDGTLSGSTGDSTDHISGHEIAKTREPYIYAVWTGGDPGQQATARVIGTKVIM